MRRRLIFGLSLFGATAGAGCGEQADKLFCSDEHCGWSSADWEALTALAGLPETPPPDTSNRYVGDPAAEQLGHKLFFDARFSGPSLQTDVLRRPVSYARVPKGQPVNVSCASCHNVSRVGVDTESVPGHVSVGAAWMDTNSPPVFNAAYYSIQMWNGRLDSLWAQAVVSAEGISQNGTRLRTAWLFQDFYQAEYNAVFSDPLPLVGTSAAVQALVEKEGPRAGQCKLAPGCPTNEGCREVFDESMSASGCFPRFPLQGKPGARPGCQPGSPTEPFGDAFDCMTKDDQDAITRVLVNYGKAIAAYEFRLVSRDSIFDRYVARLKARISEDDAAKATGFSAAARRGARLFVGKAACVECHNTPLLADGKFHNVGVPQVGPAVPTEADCPAGGVCDCVGNGSDAPPNNCLPWGARDGLAKLHKNGFRRDSRWSDDPGDTSRKRYLEIPFAPGMAAGAKGMDLDTDGAVRKGAYRTPSLRDVARTAPYMHNGLLTTLEEVIQHYNVGGSSNTVGRRSPQMKPLFLTAAEQGDLVEFLKTLDGAPVPAELTATPTLP